MLITRRLGPIALMLATSVAACGNTSSAGGAGPANSDCEAGPVVGEQLSNPDRRLEDIIETLTGVRAIQVSDLPLPVEATITDPNFGGVWGDFQGGIVVAVLDCSLVDPDELARIAGGAEFLHLIEVRYTYRQVDSFAAILAEELRELGLVEDVRIESTLEGRVIEVRVLDSRSLPFWFASDVPSDAYVIIESATVGTIPAG